jgi:integrase
VSDSDEFSENSEEFPMLDGKKNQLSFQGTQKNQNGNIRNKIHACLFCEKLFPNIARHIERVHNKELEVSKILMHPKRSKERRRMWEKLVNKGDFSHNISVLQSGNGMVIPKKRSENCSVKDLVPCEKCKALYRKKDLWKHSNFCVALDQNEKSRYPVKNGRLLLPVGNCQEQLVKKVLNSMRDDNVTLTVKSDLRIRDLGKRLFEKHGHEDHKIQYISQKLRELGRLLLASKSLRTEIHSIDDLIKSKNWDILIQSVKTVSGYDEETHSYSIPSLALKIGHSLQKCAKYLRVEGIKESNGEKIEEADRFLTLYDTEWNSDISGNALNTLGDRKYNKPLLLPVVEDVLKMNNYLAKEVAIVRENIQSKFDLNLYARLAQLCLAEMILFNRRRSGEAQRMKLQEFLDADHLSKTPDEVVLASLNEFEKRLCDTHTRVEIKGKRGRKVAVLLTDNMKENIKLLIAKRQEANVKKDLLFSKPGESMFPYRGSDCMRKFAKEAEVKYPEAFTSTKLRKQLATLCQVLNLSETSQDILATFQGHDIRVHREFYRLPEDTLQLAKVSKLLHCINNGTIGRYKGKDFDEIHLMEKGTT